MCGGKPGTQGVIRAGSPDGVFGFRRNDQFAYVDNLIGQVKAVNAMLGVDVASHAHAIVPPSHPEVIKLGSCRPRPSVALRLA